MPDLARPPGIPDLIYYSAVIDALHRLGLTGVDRITLVRIERFAVEVELWNDELGETVAYAAPVAGGPE